MLFVTILQQTQSNVRNVFVARSDACRKNYAILPLGRNISAFLCFSLSPFRAYSIPLFFSLRSMPSNYPAPTPKRPKRKRYTGFIWPKDTHPKTNSSKSLRPSRWLDILAGKGPDIFLGNISHAKSYPSQASWSQWSHVAGVVPIKTVSFLPWPFPIYTYDRPPTQIYDFNARKYKEWTPDWHPANYPCAYCCCVPWRSCKHLDARESVPAHPQPQRSMRHCSDYYDPGVLEAKEHDYVCEVCRTNLWQQHQRHEPINIPDYRCDELS